MIVARQWQIPPFDSMWKVSTGGFFSELEGRYQGSREGYIQGFLPLSLDFGGLSGRIVTSEGPHSGQDLGTLHV